LSGGTVGRPVLVIAAPFTSAYDAVFGSRLLSRSFMLRSAVASVLWVSILFLVWVLGHPLRAEIMSGESLGSLLYRNVMFALVVNLVPDYLSLIKTRLAMYWAERKRPSLAAVLIVDLAFSIALGWIGVIIFMTLIWLATGQTFWYSLLGAFRESGENLVHAVTFSGFGFILPTGNPNYRIPAPTFGVFFYSTFLASLWLWLWSLGVVLTRITSAVGHGWGRLKSVIDVDEHPFFSVAAVVVVVVLVPLWLVVVACVSLV
jgi:hypothetical protein